MIGPRRFLPSVPALLALEALDRLGTASAAAAELSLTQGAISRQVQALEGQLGVPLVIREKQRLRLTPAAQDYCGQIRQHLNGIAQASLKLRANPLGGSLNLAILPAFGMHWLAPRLAEFTRLHPEITLNLHTRLRAVDFADEGFDAAIHFGRADVPGAGHLLLLEEQILPVCAPGYLRAPLTGPQDLLALSLLQLESRTGAWGRWFAGQGLPAQRVSGMMFDQFATMTQAAIHGLGVALLPVFLIADDLAQGRLVPAWGQPGPGQGSYYLIWPKDLPERQPLVSFRSWLAKARGRPDDPGAPPA